MRTRLALICLVWIAHTEAFGLWIIGEKKLTQGEASCLSIQNMPKFASYRTYLIPGI